MKKMPIVLVALAAIAVLGSCDLLGLGEETWSYTAGTGTMTLCVEVSTSNADLKRALAQSGMYIESPCARSSGTGICTLDSMAGYSQYDVEWRYVFGSGYTDSTAQTYCSYIGGTYTQR